MRRNLITLLLLLPPLLLACPRGPIAPDRSTPRAPRAPRPAAEPFRSGVLVTWRGNEAIGRERFEDDGNLANSLFSIGGVEGRARIWRDTGLVRIEIGEERIEREMTDDILVLENGHWHAYAVVAQRFAGQRRPREVTVVVPSQNASIPATITVEPGEAGSQTVRLSLAGQQIRAEIGRGGTVRSVEIPAQRVQVRRRQDGPPPEPVVPEAPAPEDPAPAAGLPAHVEETRYTVRRDGLDLRGVLWTPTEGERWPVAVILAGSGPTDRDGNSPLGLRTDAYRLLAEALAARGVATARFDKRGVGESGTDFDAAAMTLDDFVADAVAIVEQVAAHPDLGPINVIGHSEGGLIGLRVAKEIPLDGLILLATAGRPLGEVLREQLARQLDEETMVEVDRLLADLRAGRTHEEVPVLLAPLFGPQVHVYLRSVIDVDPVPLLRDAPDDLEITIIQGGTDAQVSPADAELLAAAREDVTQHVLPKMNHVLKVEESATLPQTSYADPSRPLAPGLLDAVLEGLVTGAPAGDEEEPVP